MTTSKRPAIESWYAKAVGMDASNPHFTPDNPRGRQAVPKAWKDIDKPLTAVVTADNPLVVDHFTSFRSPFAYLAFGPLAEVQNTYNVRINVRVVYPIAIKNQQFFQDAPTYRYLHDALDMERLGKFKGIPFRFPVPDFVTTDFETLVVSDVMPETYVLIHAAAAAQEQGKAFPYVQRMMRRCWDGQTDNWQDHIEEELTNSGLDGPGIIEDVKANPDKYQAIIEQNETDNHASGHSGVPNSVFRGEPFWGQDRTDMLVWRMKQNGLTRKWPLEG
jgi:2-hydroxychromene-2-carboxylate isomerase